jgi:hypothetical protein
MKNLFDNVMCEFTILIKEIHLDIKQYFDNEERKEYYYIDNEIYTTIILNYIKNINM